MAFVTFRAAVLFVQREWCQLPGASELKRWVVLDVSDVLALSEFPELEFAIAGSPLITSMLDRWEEIDLPDCWLVAGAVIQTYWNHAFGYPASHGIDDIDIAYFDSSDLTEKTEDAHRCRIESLFGALSVRLDVKNEARVHLWYARKFGFEIAPYADVKSAIETFPTIVGAIGLRPRNKSVEIFAPYGIEDLGSLVVRPNKKLVSRPVYEAKVTRWRAAWPELQFVKWSD